jgi:rubrerythrin
MPTPDTIAELFELSIALEHAAETFYRGLGDKFAGQPEVALFWKEYEREEAGHARFLETLLERLSADKLRHNAPSELLAAARRLLEVSPESILADVTNLEEAYQIAIETENSETNLIFEALITDFAITSQAVHFLKVQLKEHADRMVREFPPPFDSTQARLAVKAQT